jgi:hypothetical protein
MLLSVFIVTVAVVLFAAPSHAALLEDLVGYWRFDEGTGTTVEDHSGEANTATFQGSPAPTWSPDTVVGPYSVDLNGSTAYLSVADDTELDFDATTDVTIQAWVKRSALGDIHTIVDKRDALHDGYYFFFAGSGNGLGFSLNNVLVYSSSGIGDTTNWHHVAIVADRDAGAQMYIDGSPDGDPVDISSAGDLDTTYDLFIGRKTYEDARYYPGNLDEVAIWNVALSAEQIENLYDLGLAGEPIPAPVSVLAFIFGGLVVGLKSVFPKVKKAWDIVSGK